MCGICGVLYTNGEQVIPENLQRIVDQMYHRGPDDSGIYIDGNFGMGMRRLSIIDIVSGHQPMGNARGNLHIILNGEIYNYRDLRGEPGKKGYIFKTNSDTESLLYAYEAYGIGCLDKLRGMFAFAIWDSQKRELFLVRDRLGIKPNLEKLVGKCQQDEFL